MRKKRSIARVDTQKHTAVASAAIADRDTQDNGRNKAERRNNNTQ